MSLSFTPIISAVMHIMHHNKWSLLKIDKQDAMFSLRYYATFKVRKFESLFCKTNAFLQKTATCIELQAKANILYTFLFHTQFFNYGRDFCGSFSMLFPKVLAFCGKKILKYFFMHCTSIFMSPKSMSQIFKVLFLTRDINNFVLCGVFFSRHVQLKSNFSDNKIISGGIWNTL